MRVACRPGNAKLKALLVGLGGIGQRHARNLRALLGDTVDLIAYRTRRLQRVVTPTLLAREDLNVESELKIRSFDSLEAALDESPQIAIVANPTSMHLPLAIDCMRAGCDLFLEKPVSHDLQYVERLLRVQEETERVAMVAYQFRFHPVFQHLQGILRDGVLGRLLAVRATVGEYLPGWHTYEDYRQMYASRADLGGGVTLTQIHEFDYLYALFGLPRRVFALGGHWSRLELDVEDTASTLIEFQVDGRPLPAHLQQDYLQRPTCRTCEIVGDSGKVLADFAGLTLALTDEAGRGPVVHNWSGFERNQLYLDELRHFLDCVANRAKPVVGLKEGVASLRIALAAKQSMESRQIVELAPSLTASHV